MFHWPSYLIFKACLLLIINGKFYQTELEYNTFPMSTFDFKIDTVYSKGNSKLQILKKKYNKRSS